ncbi:Trans-resveratrol di-O-methyltransferase [Capsicum annuum]|nr:Trans-resveratrol di-O-methyltransferase [Capsicum annuum]
MVCKLKKSLYDLKQASRQWFSKLSEALLSRDYIPSKNDYSMFTKSSGSSLVVLVVYVDDILLAGSDVTEMTSLKSFRDASFKIKDLGMVHYFLGLEITSHLTSYLMNQHKYTKDLLEEFNCSHFSSVTTPLRNSIKLSSDQGNPIPDPTVYRRLIGKLIVLQHTRPDISFSVQHLKAEYRALCKVMTEVVWLVRLLGDVGLHVTTPVPVYCDQLADMLTKALPGPLHQTFLPKLNVLTPYSLKEGINTTAISIDNGPDPSGPTVEKPIVVAKVTQQLIATLDASTVEILYPSMMRCGWGFDIFDEEDVDEVLDECFAKVARDGDLSSRQKKKRKFKTERLVKENKVGMIKCLKRTRRRGFSLTAISRLLLKDEPNLSMIPFVQAMLDPILMDPWHNLSQWIQNGGDDKPTLFAIAHYKPLYEYAGDDAKFNCLFNEAMASDSLLIISVMIEHCKGDFEGLKSLVDVGGGTGTMAKVISNEFPELKCYVLDLPRVVEGLEGSNNLSYVEGDMFKSVPCV